MPSNANERLRAIEVSNEYMQKQLEELTKKTEKVDEKMEIFMEKLLSAVDWLENVYGKKKSLDQLWKIAWGVITLITSTVWFAIIKLVVKS